jgi:hypothetical protein
MQIAVSAEPSLPEKEITCLLAILPLLIPIYCVNCGRALRKRPAGYNFVIPVQAGIQFQADFIYFQGLSGLPLSRE